MLSQTFSVGNILGTEIFQPEDAPAYIPGKIAIMVLLTVQIGVSLLLRWINLRLNANKRLALEKEKAKHGWTEADVQKERERHAFADLTDKQFVFISLSHSRTLIKCMALGICFLCTLLKYDAFLSQSDYTVRVYSEPHSGSDRRLDGNE